MSAENANRSYHGTKRYQFRAVVHFHVNESYPPTYNEEDGFEVDFSNIVRKFDNAVELIVIPADGNAGSLTIKSWDKSLADVTSWEGLDKWVSKDVHIMHFYPTWSQVQTGVPDKNKNTFFMWADCVKKLRFYPAVSTQVAVYMLCSYFLDFIDVAAPLTPWAGVNQLEYTPE